MFFWLDGGRLTIYIIYIITALILLFSGICVDYRNGPKKKNSCIHVQLKQHSVNQLLLGSYLNK